MTTPKTNPAPVLHPRKLARSMAKARTGMNRLSRIDWRKAAADQRKVVKK